MSEYKIKHYDESYIEKQVEIGNYFAQKWITYGQSSVEQVKQVYSREKFYFSSHLIYKPTSKKKSLLDECKTLVKQR